MDWQPVKGHLLPTPREAVEALLDYAEIFLRLQMDWIGYFFGIVNQDDDTTDDGDALSGEDRPLRRP